MSNNTFAGISTGLNTEDIFKYRDENMCDKWTKVEKDIGPCKVEIYGNPYGNVFINGNLKEILSEINLKNDVYVKYWAANKPNYGTSYTGE